MEPMDHFIERLNALFPPLPRWQLAVVASVALFTVAYALVQLRAGAEVAASFAPLVPLYCLWRLAPASWWRRIFWLLANAFFLWVLSRHAYNTWQLL